MFYCLKQTYSSHLTYMPTYVCEYIKPGKNKHWIYKTWKNIDINWKHQHDSLFFEKMVIIIFFYERADSFSVPPPLIIGTYTYSPLADYVDLEYCSPLKKKIQTQNPILCLGTSKAQMSCDISTESKKLSERQRKSLQQCQKRQNRKWMLLVS